MDPKEETLNLLNRIWVKLQSLPKANPIEVGAFSILLTFICECPLSVTDSLVLLKPELPSQYCWFALSAVVVLLMMVLTCLTCCCCCRKTRMKGPNI